MLEYFNRCAYVVICSGDPVIQVSATASGLQTLFSFLVVGFDAKFLVVAFQIIEC